VNGRRTERMKKRSLVGERQRPFFLSKKEASCEWSG
jgi:hypothetical protein